MNHTKSLSKATAPAHQIQDDEDIIFIVNGGFGTLSTGINGTSGSIGANSGSYSLGNMVGHLTGSSITPQVSQTNHPDLPATVFIGHDFDFKKITMTLDIEPTITAHEMMKMMLLFKAYAEAPKFFSVFAYIKKNNLERHFKFTQ